MRTVGAQGEVLEGKPEHDQGFFPEKCPVHPPELAVGDLQWGGALGLFAVEVELRRRPALLVFPKEIASFGINQGQFGLDGPFTDVSEGQVHERFQVPIQEPVRFQILAQGLGRDASQLPAIGDAKLLLQCLVHGLLIHDAVPSPGKQLGQKFAHDLGAFHVIRLVAEGQDGDPLGRLVVGDEVLGSGGATGGKKGQAKGEG